MVAGTGAIAVIVVGAAVANAAMSKPTSYRLAQVTTGSPDPALTAVGTIQPARQSTLSFPIAGRIATVSVRQGESVVGGQPLAALDTTSLSAQLSQAKSSVATARARLSADQDAQAQPPPATTGSGGDSGGASSSAPVIADTARTVAAASTAIKANASGFLIASLQKSLIADQHAADAALREARIALAQATIVCRASAAEPLPRPSPHVAATPSGTSTPREPAPTAASIGTPEPAPTVHNGMPASSSTRPDPSPCNTAESRALGSETTTYQNEQKVRTDEAALNKAIPNAAGRVTQNGVSRPPTVATRPTGATSAGAARTTAPTAEQLAADQSAVDAAAAQQQVAEQSLEQAKLVSPDTGTVRSVTLHVGDQIPAASTTEDVVISRPGGEQAVVSVPVGDIADVAQGEHATVTPDGSATALTGTVTSIAVLPNGTTYPVTLTLDDGTTVPDGSTATVSLLAGTDRGTAMVVPTSAVLARGRGYAVQVDNHGTITTVPVTVGRSGPVYTQIIGGLTVGQQVVIANLAAPLPTGSTGVRGFAGGGPGGPAGGRAGGAGGGTGRGSGPGTD